ncbi:MAG TPA: hypothetical protein VMT69_00445 [Kineosporiaceae bacterium]|nr:hypothetical protein [Kineosporiaceae bacterium]
MLMISPAAFLAGLIITFLLISFWRQLLALALVAVLALVITGLLTVISAVSQR